MALLEQPPRPKSMVDFIKTEGDSTAAVIRRCKTPTSSMYNSQPPSSKCLSSSRRLLIFMHLSSWRIAKTSLEYVKFFVHTKLEEYVPYLSYSSTVVSFLIKHFVTASVAGQL